MRIISLATLLFAATLAVVIGYRIDPRELAILAGVTVGFVIAAIAVGGVAIFVTYINRRPSHQIQHGSDVDWEQPYHVQHPLPTTTKQKQLLAPAVPQYDDTVTFTLKQPQRKWVAVDEVTR